MITCLLILLLRKQLLLKTQAVYINKQDTYSDHMDVR